MNRISVICFTVLCCLQFNTSAQTTFDLEGQATLLLNYSPENTAPLFLGLRYLPKAKLVAPIDSSRKFDFECSLNITTIAFAYPFDSITGDADTQFYRLWARYTSKQFELRAGLQKIDFGSATILRPLQWFNQVDPRDPLQITNGVYSLLSRYYFLNNTNIWVWGLLGNKKPRGYDFLDSNQWLPEVGTRIQTPIPKGEIALSYHYRNADTRTLNGGLPLYEKLPENRVALDGKWDLGVGLWLEYTYINRQKYFGPFTSMNLLTTGTDYTFAIGNGLNVVGEHLFLTGGHMAFDIDFVNHISALMINYPIGPYDQLSFLLSYGWEENLATAFLNYQHQFKHITSYFMVYYNPSGANALPVSNQTTNFGGPGIRLLLVYNH